MLEDARADPEVLGVCQMLVANGYRVALDDVTEVARLKDFEGVVTLVKVDLVNQAPSTVETSARYAHDWEAVATRLARVELDGNELSLMYLRALAESDAEMEAVASA